MPVPKDLYEGRGGPGSPDYSNVPDYATYDSAGLNRAEANQQRNLRGMEAVQMNPAAQAQGGQIGHGVFGLLESAAQGGQPSVAQQQLQAGGEQIQRGIGAQMATGRQGAGLQQAVGQQAGSQAQAMLNQQQGQLRAGEMAQARGQLADTASVQAQMQQQLNLSNAEMQNVNAQVNAQLASQAQTLQQQFMNESLNRGVSIEDSRVAANNQVAMHMDKLKYNAWSAAMTDATARRGILSGERTMWDELGLGGSGGSLSDMASSAGDSIGNSLTSWRDSNMDFFKDPLKGVREFGQWAGDRAASATVRDSASAPYGEMNSDSEAAPYASESGPGGDPINYAPFEMFPGQGKRDPKPPEGSIRNAFYIDQKNLPPGTRQTVGDYLWDQVGQKTGDYFRSIIDERKQSRDAAQDEFVGPPAPTEYGRVMDALGEAGNLSDQERGYRVGEVGNLSDRERAPGPVEPSEVPPSLAQKFISQLMSDYNRTRDSDLDSAQHELARRDSQDSWQKEREAHVKEQLMERQWADREALREHQEFSNRSEILRAIPDKEWAEYISWMSPENMKEIFHQAVTEGSNDQLWDNLMRGLDFTRGQARERLSEEPYRAEEDRRGMLEEFLRLDAEKGNPHRKHLPRVEYEDMVNDLRRFDAERGNLSTSKSEQAPYGTSSGTPGVDRPYTWREQSAKTTKMLRKARTEAGVDPNRGHPDGILGYFRDPPPGSKASVDRRIDSADSKSEKGPYGDSVSYLGSGDFGWDPETGSFKQGIGKAESLIPPPPELPGTLSHRQLPSKKTPTDFGPPDETEMALDAAHKASVATGALDAAMGGKDELLSYGLTKGGQHLGGMAGGAIGGAVGGPAGAAVGATIGGVVGGAAGGAAGSAAKKAGQRKVDPLSLRAHQMPLG